MAARGCGFWFLVMTVGVIGLFVWSSDGDEEESAARVAVDVRPVLQMTVREYQQAWGNEPAARERFAANRVAMAGTVEAVSINLSGKAVLRLESPDPTLPMTLHFTEAEQPGLSGLTVGGQAAAVCSRAEKVLGIPVLLDCALAQ